MEDAEVQDLHQRNRLAWNVVAAVYENEVERDAADLHLLNRRVYSQTHSHGRVLLSPRNERWQPLEGLSPEDVQAVIAAVGTERDRLLLTKLWAPGARISEVLTLRPRDIHGTDLSHPTSRTQADWSRQRTSHPPHAGPPGDMLV